MTSMFAFAISPIDTWIFITASLAAAACAIPGCFLFLRKQSMIADGLTHAAFPGVIGAFILAGVLESYGWIPPDGGWAARQGLMFAGAMFVGMLTAYLTEWITRSGYVRSDAALGIVFTTLFAIGLILMGQFADRSHIDPDCVLYGQLELVGLVDPEIPEEAIACAIMLVINSIAVVVFFQRTSDHNV